MYKKITTLFLLPLSSLLFSSFCYGQTPPELAALSLQELMGLSIEEPYQENSNDNRWKVSYGYQKSKLDGYRSGRNNLSDAAVLFTAPETRTTKNYPILPTVITQEVHTLNLNYQWNNDIELGLTAPYIKLSTDHKSSLPGFSEFKITTEGIGDISLSVAYKLPIKSDANWRVSAAISLPTGSVTEKGDTPRNGSGTKEDLPYTMQLGSGTYALPVALSYSHAYQAIHYGGQINAMFRTGKNKHGYRLGNTYGATTWARWMTNSFIHPGFSINYRHSDEIHGTDDELLVAGAFPFPANISDPANYGGDKIDLGASLRFCSMVQQCKYYVDLNASKALYQRLNGIQIKEQFTIGITTGMSF